MLYLEVGGAKDPHRHGRMALLPVGADGVFADTAHALSAAAAMIPHAQLALSIGAEPTTCAYIRRENRSNSFRIPMH